MMKAALLGRVRAGARRPSQAWSGASEGARRAPALAAGLLWLAAGLSGGYWLLHAMGRTAFTPVAVAAPGLPQADAAAVARALGAVPAVPQAAAAAPATRYRLLGVVSREGQSGAALIARDDQPPRPYVVGASLEGGLVLQSVDRRGARLGLTLSGPASVELSLPEKP